MLKLPKRRDKSLSRDEIETGYEDLKLEPYKPVYTKYDIVTLKCPNCTSGRLVWYGIFKRYYCDQASGPCTFGIASIYGVSIYGLTPYSWGE